VVFPAGTWWLRKPGIKGGGGSGDPFLELVRGWRVLSRHLDSRYPFAPP